MAKSQEESDADSIGDFLADTLTFTSKQIEYLRDEFDRQRRWIESLTTRESAALKELEYTQNSLSYRLGRTLTYPLRKIDKVIKRNMRKEIRYFTEEEVEKEDALFSPIIISPGLLPETGTHGKPDIFVEELLLSLRRSALSVNTIRDLIQDTSYGMDSVILQDCLARITAHIIETREYRPSIRNFFVAAVRVLSLNNAVMAVEYFDQFEDSLNDVRASRTMIQTHTKIGNMREPLKLLNEIKQDQWTREMKAKIIPQMELLENGFPHKITTSKKKWFSENEIIMYCASQCLPHTSSGYAIRTHGLVKALRDTGSGIIVYARHGYPLDRMDFTGEFTKLEENIDSIPYVFNPSNRSNGIPEIIYSDVFNFTRFAEYQKLCLKTLISQASKVKPAIIHAASNFVVGMAAVDAAKVLGIPSIYEIRGFWHISQASKRIGYEKSDHYSLSESMEIDVASRADYVFAITQGIADILIDNGVDSDKISILPNAVDVEKFMPIPRDGELEDELELIGTVVLGYIGSFVEYEGLDLLLQAVASIRADVGENLRVLLVGDGPVFEELRDMSRFLGINDIVTMTGRVDHEEVQRYYSLIDIAAFPRKARMVCELVSPMKPFEAMAMKKAVIASNVQALSEIVDDGVTGLLHKKDDVDSLADCIKKLVLDDKLRENLASEGRKWVEKHRTWESVTKIVAEKYDELQSFPNHPRQ